MLGRNDRCRALPSADPPGRAANRRTESSRASRSRQIAGAVAMAREGAVIASGQSLQRNLETHDLTGTIIYLASDASRFVPGQTIMVDGGTVFL